MRRIRLAIVGVFLLLLSTAAPASAITYGQLDDGEHPYVGFMIFFSPNDPGWFSCSGTLLDSTTFLTAGHCTFPVGTDGEPTAGDSGGNDVWVTFDDTEVLKGWPARESCGPVAVISHTMCVPDAFQSATSSTSDEITITS